jgi:hypothetical protein
MTKRIEKDGKFYRLRRRKLVEIPAEWRGQVTSQQTINARPSKAIHKLRKLLKLGYESKEKESLETLDQEMRHEYGKVYAP